MKYEEKNYIPMIIAWIVVIVILLTFIFGTFYTIQSGEVGVVSTFGKFSNDLKYAGLHMKIPIVQSLYVVNVKTLQIEEEMAVPSKEGLVFSLDVSIIYNIIPEQASQILQTVSGNVEDTLLIPYMRSEVRDIVSGKEARDIYSDSGRGEVEKMLKSNLQEKLKDKIIIQDALLRKVTLPDTVKNAIESKLSADQKAQQKEFELIQAKKDAEIEVARAEGVAQSNKIVSGSITENYLRYRWIEGLQTNNMMVVYVPTEGNIPIMEAGRIPKLEANINTINTPVVEK
jgi:prohibitin 1